MSESLRNDGRVWIPASADDQRPPAEIPESERNYYLEKKYPAFGNLVPRDVASRNAKEQCDQGKGVGDTGLAVYLDFSEAVKRDGEASIRRKYGNLFDMYERITASDPVREPMQIYPAVHYTMGGLWVDYNLMTNIPGLYALGEANFSDHGANRLGASALMQGLADGYFILPSTIGNYLAGAGSDKISVDHGMFAQAEQAAAEQTSKLLSIKGTRTVDGFHRELGQIMWNHCGMARNQQGLEKALELIPALRDEFWQNVLVPGHGQELNQSLERAGRVADFMEFAELMVEDALAREESCGCHLREESQTKEHEAQRDDANYSYTSVWEYQAQDRPKLHKEPLTFETVEPSRRNYK
jgi:succinate dehydrogenase / fumarate reductase flavoprotein subunit